VTGGFEAGERFGDFEIIDALFRVTAE